MFPKLKYYLSDKDLDIEQTIIRHLEKVAQTFVDYCGKKWEPTNENDWIIEPIRNYESPSISSSFCKGVYGHHDGSSKLYFFYIFQGKIPKVFRKYQLLDFHVRRVSNRCVCASKIVSICDNLELDLAQCVY